ncbi:hypothetical protein B296_00053650, partial [Ensete ventricosum]
VPQGLESEQGVPLNKGNIYIAENSPPQVVKAYQEQHRRDFSTFLKSRYVELSVGGGMVLAFLGRRNKHPADGELSYLSGLLAEALNAMASRVPQIFSLRSRSEVSDRGVSSFFMPSLRWYLDLVRSKYVRVSMQLRRFRERA